MAYEDYVSKAQKSLKAARILFEAELYDSCISRCYYAMFQVAVATVAELGIRPPKEGAYSHSWVQAVIAQEVIHRRKRLPRKFASYLPLVLELRQEADYKEVEVSRKKAERAVRMAMEFLEGVKRV